MEYQYEYFMSDALALPKDAWKPFHNAGPVLSYPKTNSCTIRATQLFAFITSFPAALKPLSVLQREMNDC